MSTTTQEEFVAIMALAVKAKRANGTLHKTEEQYNIVMEWGNKWMEAQKYNRKKAIEWNKKHPDKHREANKMYYRRTMKNNPEKIREYRRKYYKEVLKPRRQAQKGEK